MKTYTQEVRKMIEHSPKKERGGFNPIRYMGTVHPYLGLANATKYTIAKTFKNNHPDLSFNELMELLDSLNTLPSFEEKTIGPAILECYQTHQKNIKPRHLENWLNNLEGWCEIDTLCQSRFDAEMFLNNWDVWYRALIKFSMHNNINHRRASLVLLCKPVRNSDDRRLYDLAIANIETVKHERDILITKAISWILREMTKQFKTEVAEYLKKNEKTLPAIAVRETKKTLLTGKK